MIKMRFDKRTLHDKNKPNTLNAIASRLFITNYTQARAQNAKTVCIFD